MSESRVRYNAPLGLFGLVCGVLGMGLGCAASIPRCQGGLEVAELERASAVLDFFIQDQSGAWKTCECHLTCAFSLITEGKVHVSVIIDFKVSRRVTQ